jgi:ribonucleotide monophosphatase NagD (HAD superfamily)
MLRRHLAGLGVDRSALLNVYMVGDNPESDIAGANAYGWKSLLVKTGVYREGKPAHEPTRVVEDVEEALEWAVQNELRE